MRDWKKQVKRDAKERGTPCAEWNNGLDLYLRGNARQLINSAIAEGLVPPDLVDGIRLALQHVNCAILAGPGAEVCAARRPPVDPPRAEPAAAAQPGALPAVCAALAPAPPHVPAQPVPARPNASARPNVPAPPAPARPNTVARPNVAARPNVPAPPVPARLNAVARPNVPARPIASARPNVGPVAAAQPAATEEELGGDPDVGPSWRVGRAAVEAAGRAAAEAAERAAAGPGGAGRCTQKSSEPDDFDGGSDSAASLERQMAALKARMRANKKRAAKAQRSQGPAKAQPGKRARLQVSPPFQWLAFKLSYLRHPSRTW